MKMDREHEVSGYIWMAKLFVNSAHFFASNSAIPVPFQVVQRVAKPKVTSEFY